MAGAIIAFTGKTGDSPPQQVQLRYWSESGLSTSMAEPCVVLWDPALNVQMTPAKDASITSLTTTVAKDTSVLSLTTTVAKDATLVSIYGIMSGTADVASGKTPITGTFSGTGQSASFTPIANRAFNVSIWGTSVASVQLERSFDSGSTWLRITAAGVQMYQWNLAASLSYSESVFESEKGVLYRLNCTAYTSGPFSYRVSQ